MQIIDGKTIALKIRQELKEKIAASGIRPGLAAILVGADPASHLYVFLKEKACAELGIHFEKYLFSGAEPEEKIIEQIQSLNQRPDIHGILVQLPLPSQYNENKIIQIIDPNKDADGFHPANLKLLEKGQPNIVPVIVRAIIKLIESVSHPLFGKQAVVVANSSVFASPIKKILGSKGAKTEIIIYNPDLSLNQYPIIPTADIVITAIGRTKIITGSIIKNDAVVIDVGTTRVNFGTEEAPEWKTVGDVDFESTTEKNGFITPVPGGVGPMTIALLLENVFELSTRASHKK